MALPSPSGRSTVAGLAGAALAEAGSAAPAAGCAGADDDCAGAEDAALEPASAAAGLGPKLVKRYCARVSTFSSGMRAPRSIMVRIVSFQSSKSLCALVRFVSLWQSWQNSVAIGLPSPSGSTTGFGAAGAAGVAVGGAACESDWVLAGGVACDASCAAAGIAFKECNGEATTLNCEGGAAWIPASLREGDPNTTRPTSPARQARRAASLDRKYFCLRTFQLLQGLLEWRRDRLLIRWTQAPRRNIKKLQSSGPFSYE